MEINYKNIFISVVCLSAITGLGYAFYFDHKRRNDSKFRKELKKKKNAQKSIAKDEDEKTHDEMVAESAKKLAAIYKKVKDEPAPKPAEFEQFFFSQLTKGEMLIKEGPEYFEAAATELFRAIAFCPNPVEVILMLENIVPKPVNEIVLALFSLELKTKREEFMEFYDKFPAPEKNVKLVEDPKQPESAAVEGVKKFYAIATKDFEAGEVIYTEKPIASTLVPTLEGKGFCSVCFKKTNAPIKHSFLEREYCSESCHETAVNEFPAEAPTKGSLELVTHFKDSGKMLASMLGRTLSKAFHQHESGNVVNPETENYTPILHTERYIAVDFTPDEQSCATEVELIQDYLRHRTEDADQVITLDYYKATISKFSRACFAVVNAPEDPLVIASPKTDEPIRYVVPGPFTGCGFYPLTAYLNGGLAEANCQVEFRSGDYVLTLVSTKPIKKGEGFIVTTFDSSSAKGEADIPNEADFPPLVQEDSQKTPEIAHIESGTPTSSYAEVVAESPEPSEEKHAESSDATPSYSQVVQDSAPEATKEKDAESHAAPSYAAVAAEEPSAGSDVITHDEVASSQEFEKVEATPESS
ncbi:mitochondrial import receptor subunit tom20 [Entomophthora muscae]|uniref:Mitochondrial import receptor subunit tom20 n=1 Tax=Entomophthora muscae TaxID=34485 RepID=A0ACC2SK84_9FUNG|nr:mitochondrial import receptor subunit tom20 [Entomophthora muscae]